MADGLQIHFRPMARDDLGLMHRWVNNGFVARWWPGWPSLEQVRVKYSPRINGEEPVRCFIVEIDESPTAFIQCYRIRDVPQYAIIGVEAANAAGIDLFIAERERAYRGLGPLIIREFLRGVVFRELDVDSCIIGPAHNNRAAIRAYEKVGFKHLKTVSIPGELEPEYLMRIDSEEFVRRV
jgi:RimJ/RimL family protein N-acetyltransferase